MAKFKKADDYVNPVLAGPYPEPARPSSVREFFFRLKLMPASLVQYAVEQVTVIDDQVVERRTVTERDILPITLSKIEDLIVQQVRR